MPSQKTDLAVFFREVTINLASINACTTSVVSATVPDVRSTDVIIAVIPPKALEQGLHVEAAGIAADNTVCVRVSNTNVAAVDGSEGVFTFVIGRR